MDMPTNTFVATQIAEQATPLRLDLDAPFDDLAPLANRARDGKVVALGSATRQSHELSVLTHRVMRFLIDEHAFRSLALEGGEAASFDLDTYVRTGEGDPLAILARARPFLRLAREREDAFDKLGLEIVRLDSKMEAHLSAYLKKAGLE